MDRFIFLQIATNLDLSYLKFQGQGGGGNPVFLGILGGLVLAIIIVMTYLYYTRRRRLIERTKLREEARLKLLLSESSLGAEDRKQLEILVESEDPTNVVPLLSMRTLFESTVQKFREAHPGDAAIRKVPQLRQRLGYGFSNPRNPFTNTRMLASGLKMQCTIPHRKRDVRYVTTVLSVSEDMFFVRPPVARGKPVALSGFSTLDFKISRDNDAEYEFTAPILDQTKDGVRALRMEHTGAIRKLLYREAPRTAVAVDIQFYVIRQEIAAEKRHRVFRRDESQFALSGKTRDLSLSGLCIIAEVESQKPTEGDFIVFKLPEAQIKDDIVAEIVHTVSLNPKELQLHLQMSGLKEINRLKLSKFLQNENEAPSGDPPAAAASAAP